MDHINNGVQNLSIDKTKKKRRAFHDLNAVNQQSNFNNNFGQPFTQNSLPSSNQPTPQLNQNQFPQSFTPQLDQQQQPFASQFTPHSQFNSLTPQQQFTPQFTPQQQFTPQFASQQQFTPQRNQQSQYEDAFAKGDILSAPFVRLVQQKEYYTKPFNTLQNTVPPTATTRLITNDEGVASPAFKRLSLYNIPVSESLRLKSGLPLGLTVRPFAPTNESIPEVDFTELIEGPIRCNRCRTFINPHFEFNHQQKFKCKMCGFPNNHVPYEYNSPIDPQTNFRADKYQRPELHKGVYDILVPKNYAIDGKDQLPLHIVYLIDVSASNDIISTITEAIRESLDYLNPLIKIAIITFDSTIHFYNLNKSRPEVHIVSDLDDPFVPFADIFADPREVSWGITDCLNQINELYNDFKSIENCYGSALKVASQLLKEVGGGKIISTLSKLPNYGPGKLTINSQIGGSHLFKAENKFYTDLSNEFINNHVGLDLFVFNSQSIDLINSSLPVFKTNGNLRDYSNFIPDRDLRRFKNDLISSITSIVGFQGELKTRVSNGLSIQSYYGNITDQNSPKFPILSTEQEVSILFKYDNVLNKKDDVYFQTSVLYTGIDGKRRIRIINMVVSITEQITEVFSFANQDIISNIIIKNCLNFLPNQEPLEVKKSTTLKLIEIYKNFRTHCENSNLISNQLVLPNSLNLLLPLILSFQKSKIFKSNGIQDARIFDYYLLNSLPLENLLYKLYPIAFQLHNLGENDAIFDEFDNFIVENEPVRLSSQFVINGGVYLFFNGLELFLYVTPNANPNLLLDLFDVQSLDEILPFLPQLNTKISQQARNIVKFVSNYLRLNDQINIKLIRKGIESDNEIMDLLIEDRSNDKTESYMEFISFIHKRIKRELENKGSKNNNYNYDNVNVFNNQTVGATAHYSQEHLAHI
ncbi:hypothetical protein WICMUC_001633 [Wickerhamomyces mucosus]|uniref:Uncharacterized protein n=1 Tax=Wickerhamomyces mucosus TaxID=1378264 RepID=A0A9P8PVL3_9ASCO|nr:hypothetical protein WICMUC_001633 [Wickerhamomyces mucosus]